jgi:hypothetical protein
MLLFFWSNSSKGTCGIPKPVNHQRSPTWPLQTPGNRCWILQTRPNPRKLRLGESSWGQKLISCIIHTKEESPRKNRDVIYIITDLLGSHFIHVFSFPFRNKTSRTKSIVFSLHFHNAVQPPSPDQQITGCRLKLQTNSNWSMQQHSSCEFGAQRWYCEALVFHATSIFLVDHMLLRLSRIDLVM